jgi:hypothetical protein
MSQLVAPVVLEQQAWLKNRTQLHGMNMVPVVKAIVEISTKKFSHSLSKFL